MRRNYKISEHRIYHAWVRTVDCTSTVLSMTWQGFLRPVMIIAVGFGLAAPFGHVAARVLEKIIW